MVDWYQGNQNHQISNIELPVACLSIEDAMSVLEGERPAMSKKRHVVLFLSKELVNKTKELGFNLSRTFENHLKYLITQFSSVDTLMINDEKAKSSPEEIRTLVGGSKARYA